jgi:hypothetical protein
MTLDPTPQPLNPSDPCQTIASGVGFRFEDLKSVFKLEADRQKEETGTKSLPANFAVKIPEVMTLSVNYRCVWCMGCMGS